MVFLFETTPICPRTKSLVLGFASLSGTDAPIWWVPYVLIDFVLSGIQAKGLFDRPNSVLLSISQLLNVTLEITLNILNFCLRAHTFIYWNAMACTPIMQRYFSYFALSVTALWYGCPKILANTLVYIPRIIPEFKFTCEIPKFWELDVIKFYVLKHYQKSQGFSLIWNRS